MSCIQEMKYYQQNILKYKTISLHFAGKMSSVNFTLLYSMIFIITSALMCKQYFDIAVDCGRLWLILPIVCSVGMV